jgi:poly(A) polymerase
LDPDAVKVVRRLVAHHHQAYFVGGCVRDLLLGCAPKDFDVATSARPPELRQLFRNCRIIGRRFRLAHVHFRDGKIIEVATFRRDPPPNGDDDLYLKTDNFFGTPHEDALRRDFTINALFYDLPHRQIIDYASGLTDVDRRLLRTIGDANIRLQEDPVRALRAIKFTARQDLGMAPELYEAVVRHRGLLQRAAPPRVLEEIFRLLRGGAAHRSMWLAHEMGVLGEMLPELSRHLQGDCRRLHRSCQMLQALDHVVSCRRCPSDAVLLAVLLASPLQEAMAVQRDTGRAIRDALGPLAERLVVPRKIRDRVRQIMAAQRRLAQPDKVLRSSLPKRDYYPDAVDYWEIYQHATGNSGPQLSDRRERLLSTVPAPEPRQPRLAPYRGRPRRRNGRRPR